MKEMESIIVSASFANVNRRIENAKARFLSGVCRAVIYFSVLCMHILFHVSILYVHTGYVDMVCGGVLVCAAWGASTQARIDIITQLIIHVLKKVCFDWFKRDDLFLA